MTAKSHGRRKVPAPPARDALFVAGRPGEAEGEALARIAYDPAARAVGVARKFIAPVMGERPLQDSYGALIAQIEKLSGGNLSGVERTLAVQADTLDAVFNDLLRRAAMNAGQYLEAMELYMRLALKAQSQCRATLETLAAIKNPPVVFAKQANIAAGPQQINNGVAGPDLAPAGNKDEIKNQPHALVEAAPASRTNARGAPLLSHEQAVPPPMQSAGGTRPARVQDARRAGRSTDREG